MTLSPLLTEMGFVTQGAVQVSLGASGSCPWHDQKLLFDTLKKRDYPDKDKLRKGVLGGGGGGGAVYVGVF